MELILQYRIICNHPLYVNMQSNSHSAECDNMELHHHPCLVGHVCEKPFMEIGSSRRGTQCSAQVFKSAG